MSGIVNIYNSVLAPIEWLVAWIMYGFHQFLTTIGLPSASGWTWGLSIVGLVLVMRAAMIPLFVKQIMASRKMQLIQPELQKIQKKYKGKSDPESRQAMTQETMELYRREGTNPFSSCLPILVQSPFFFGLFRVLDGLTDVANGKRGSIGPITRAIASEAEKAQLFGAQLSETFTHATTTNTRVLTVILIILMSVTTFTTQRQLMTKNMPSSALDNPFAKQQKLLMYVLPLFFAVSGINFPIGVLIYWFTTNLWSMAQQFYVIRRMPAPGSAAEKAMHDRLKRRGKAIPGFPAVAAAGDAAGAEEIEPDPAPRKQSGQRQQPKGKRRSKGGRTGVPGQGDTRDDDGDPGTGAGGAADPGRPASPGGPGDAAGGSGQGSPRTGRQRRPRKPGGSDGASAGPR